MKNKVQFILFLLGYTFLTGASNVAWGGTLSLQGSRIKQVQVSEDARDLVLVIKAQDVIRGETSSGEPATCYNSNNSEYSFRATSNMTFFREILSMSMSAKLLDQEYIIFATEAGGYCDISTFSLIN